MARIIEAEGRRIEVPDDATDDEINEIFGAPAAAPMAQAEASAMPAPSAPPPMMPGLTDGPQTSMDAPAAAPALPSGTIPAAAPSAPAESSRTGSGDSPIRAGVQGAGRSVADLLGFVPDLPAMGANVLLAGGDNLLRMAGGPKVDFRFPLPSEEMANTASSVAKLIGYDVMDPEKMSGREKLAYNVNRFGGQAAVGGGALAKAGAARAGEMTAKSLPKMGDDFLRPYFANPIKTAAGDSVAGAGAGVGLTTTQQLPDSVRDAGGGVVGPGLDLIAMLAGGVGGGTAAEIATRTPVSVTQGIRGSMPARDVTLDPGTMLPTTNRAADKAARYVQGQAIDPEAAATNIQRNVADFGNEGLPVPTTGLISGDTGLEMIERGQRVKNSTGTIVNTPDAPPGVKADYSFGERDTKLRDAAVEQVDSIRGDGNPEAFVQRAQDVGDARVTAAQRQADKAAGEQRAVSTAMEEPARDLQAFEGQGQRASRSIDAEYRNTRQRELARKNRLYRDPELARTEVPVEPLVAVADDLRALDTQAAPLDGTISKYVDRFRRQEVDPETGEVTRPGFAEGDQITMREANAMRSEIEKDIQSNLDNGEVVRQLRLLKNTVSQYVEDLAAGGNDLAQAAVRNYAERVRPNFRAGAGGRMNNKMAADQLGTKVRPSNTAKEFLTLPEDARDLMRIARLGGSTEQTTADARTWLFDQLAQKGVVKDNAIDGAKLARWRNRNSDLLTEVPGLRQEVNNMVRDAQRGGDLRTQYGADLKAAETRVRETRQSVDSGPIGMVAGKDPQKAVGSVFGSGNPEAAMRELKSTVGRNKDAMDGMKAAVADYFEAKVSNVNPANVSEGSQSIGYAQLVKEFNKNEKALAQVFDADEMNALRRAQKLLEPLGRRQGQATTGSVTAENNEQAWRAIEAGTKLWFGMLKGGGIMRSIRLAASTLGDDSVEQANRLVARMMFDPKLAQHLLTRKTAEVGSPAWNSQLQKIIRRTQVVKELQEPDDEK